MKSGTLGVAIVGLGNWGSRLARAFSCVPRSRLLALCDTELQRLSPYSGLPEDPALLTDPSEALRVPGVDAVVVATPPASHASLASQALHAGRHVFVEKPMALSMSDATRLQREAALCARTLMVGHILEYHPAFERLSELIQAGELGRILHVSCERRGRGCIRHETAWWSLAPHDLSLLQSVFDGEPLLLDVRARGHHAPEEAVVAELAFPGGATARIEVSAVDSAKTRRVTVFGTRRIAVFDDQEPVHKLRLYTARGRADDGARRHPPDRLSHHSALLGLECSAVPIESEEPLLREVRHFVDAVLAGRPVRTGPETGLRVVSLLEAGQAQLDAAARRPPAPPDWDGEPQAPPA